MPRLLGVREHITMDLWDSFSPRDLLSAERSTWDPHCRRLHLYGNANVGSYIRTNIQVAGCIASDQTAVIQNWYARTNLVEVYEDVETSEFTRAWTAWTNASSVTLMVGCRPVYAVPLASLFGPRTFGNLCGVRQIGDEDDIRKIAEDAYRRADGDIELAVAIPAQRTLADLPEAEQEIWLRVARACPLYRPIIVPLRQHCSVTIDADARATDALLRVIPERVAPMPLVWVHLVGIASRDVA